ncbi:MAG TPA: hypothetical protein DEB20_01270 [Acidimicrobiaceae bacterium]|nr:hypothetical protein [Acidimicrobiaceae bacterium]
MRWRLGALIALMLGMVLAACGSTSVSTEPTTPSTSTTIPTVAEGSVGAWVEVTSTTIDAGNKLTATVVVVNHSGSPITVASCGAIYGAGFESDTIRLGPSFFTCLGPPQQIPLGESRWPVTASATYPWCGGSGVSETPACVDGRPPALAGGEYRLVAGSSDSRAPKPAPVIVNIR